MVLLIKINQLPDSVTRWRHRSWKSFETFVLVKNYNIVIDLTTTEAGENKQRSVRILEFFDHYYAKFKNNQILYTKMLIYSDNQAIYKVKPNCTFLLNALEQYIT